MKKALPAIAAWAWAALGHGQCGPCSIGDTCTVDPPFPAVCPTLTPVGVVGVPYALDATFWVPASFPEPTTQLNVVLQQVTLISMENVPVGLTYEANSPTLTYYPQSNEFGCVRICGTPMVAGADTIRIVVDAQGTVGGVAVTTSYTIPIPINVLNSSADTVPDFVFAPDSLCAPANIAFGPVESAQGMTAQFNWSFGNGSSHTGAAPPNQTYDESGTYPVSLESIFSAPVLTQLSVSGVSNAWCGDLDEPNLPLVGCIGQPDLYFTITDSRLALTRSPVVANAQSTSWTGLSSALGFPPFTLRIYDKDELSADDLLGSFTITNATGTQGFGQSGTAGSLDVAIQTFLTRIFSDTVTVFGAPELELGLDLDAATLCVAPDDLAQYEWSFNGEPVAGIDGPCIPAANGSWSVTATTAQGCIGTAATEVLGVRIDEASEPRGWRLAPNPAAEELFVLSDDHALASAAIAILDPFGRIIRDVPSSRSAGTLLRVGLDGLSDGQYMLRIVLDGATWHHPFVVLRN